MSVDISGSFNVGELTGFENMTLEKITGILKSSAEKTIKDQVMSCYSTTQKLNADIYGFGTYIYRHHTKEWKPIEDKWDQIYPSLELTLNMKTEIADIGKSIKSPEMEEVR